MQELIDKIKSSTGLNDEQAKKSIEIVSDYLKSKTPKSFHLQIDNMIDGGKLSDGIKEQLMEAVVKAKETTEDIVKEAADKLEEVIKDLRGKFKNNQ